MIKERWDRGGAPGSGYSSHLDPGSQPGPVLPLEEFDNVWRHFCVIKTRGESRECYWHLVDRDQDAAKHLTTHRTATHSKELSGLGTDVTVFLLVSSSVASLGLLCASFQGTTLETGRRMSDTASLLSQ